MKMEVAHTTLHLPVRANDQEKVVDNLNIVIIILFCIAMTMALLCADNCYYIPNFYVEGVLCQTNLPTNTYTRGPGCIAALYFLESILERVATSLSLPADIVKPLNFYQKGQVTPYGQPLPYFRFCSLLSHRITSS